MAEPLPLAYAWQPRVLGTGVVAVVCGAALAHDQPPGWVGVLLLVALLEAVVVTLVWARTRAYLQVDGPRLRVRNLGRTHTVEARQLVRVRQFLTRSGPSYRLVVLAEDGRRRSRVVPTAVLRGGHSTLFGWILAHAPQVELDRGSARTLDQLRVRGLVG